MEFITVASEFVNRFLSEFQNIMDGEIIMSSVWQIITLLIACAVPSLLFMGILKIIGLFCEDRTKIKDPYFVKYYIGLNNVDKFQKKWERSLPKEVQKNLEYAKSIEEDLASDNHFIYAVDQKGNSLALKFTNRKDLVAEVYICLRLANSAVYTFLEKPTKLYRLKTWSWKTKDLHIEILEPFKRLRVTFNGFLLNTNRKVEHVQFNFLWVAAGAPQFHPQDTSTRILAKALAQQTWRDKDYIEFLGNFRGYEQFGTLHGLVKSASISEDTLSLSSCRSKFWGNDEKVDLERSIHLFVAAADGAMITLWLRDLKDDEGKGLLHGYVRMNDGAIKPIIDCDLKSEDFGSYESSLTAFSAEIEVPGKLYRTFFHLREEALPLPPFVDDEDEDDSATQLIVVPADCDLPTQQAKSLVEFYYINISEPRDPPPPLLVEQQSEDVRPDCYVVHFKDESSKNVRLTGGKGCSLALLTSLNSDEFVVPDGFIVTVNAFKRQIETDYNMMKAVSTLEDICAGRGRYDLKIACHEAVKVIENIKILPAIKKEIMKALETVEDSCAQPKSKKEHEENTEKREKQLIGIAKLLQNKVVEDIEEKLNEAIQEREVVLPRQEVAEDITTEDAELNKQIIEVLKKVKEDTRLGRNKLNLKEASNKIITMFEKPGLPSDIMAQIMRILDNIVTITNDLQIVYMSIAGYLEDELVEVLESKNEGVFKYYPRLDKNKEASVEEENEDEDRERRIEGINDRIDEALARIKEKVWKASTEDILKQTYAEIVEILQKEPHFLMKEQIHSYLEHITSKEKLLDSTYQDCIKMLQTEERPTDTSRIHISESFAVRSSAVGEDSDILSAAGQNATVLNVSNPEDVIRAVKTCWASLFSYQSVTYRHRNGLPVSSQMAVVVQRWVRTSSAGVLFTCNPTRGDKSEIVITANFDSGDNVVSGRNVPDRFILDRTYDNRLSIKYKKVGDKRTREERKNNVEPSETFCITDKQALEVGQVGVALEEEFGGTRDIEWGYYQGRLFVLQARPVTTLNQYALYDFEHEFDVATPCEDMYYTIGNTGEVLPGAISALTMSTIVGSIDRGIQKNIEPKTDPYALKVLATFKHHLFIDAINGIHRIVAKTIDKTARCLDLAIFGHPILTEEMHALAVSRRGVATAVVQGREMWKGLKAAFRNKANAALCKKAASQEIGVDKIRDTVRDVYEKIERSLEIFDDIMYYHSSTTRTSVTYQMIILRTLTGNEDFTVDHYNDASSLLASCDDVISAEVPKRLTRIAAILIRNNLAEEFSKIEPEKAMDWLKDNSPHSAKLLSNLTEDHGHRGAGEFDLCNETWSTDPTNFVKMIQAKIRNPETEDAKLTRVPRKDVDLDELVADLRTPLNWIGQKWLIFILNLSRNAVRLREETKSESIRFVNKLRIAYKYLSERMVEAGLIPYPELIFHLTHFDIGQIIDGNERSPILIKRARIRLDLYPEWNATKYPEISHGMPQSVRRTFIPRTGSGEVRCEGTPVYYGHVEARACVIHDLNDIGQLQKGDILITYSTDIGWSPYFPLLKGIVTELGGLVSHGAVIAREYGLPCIVGATGATKLFKTGDTIILSGESGIIELI